MQIKIASFIVFMILTCISGWVANHYIEIHQQQVLQQLQRPTPFSAKDEFLSREYVKIIKLN